MTASGPDRASDRPGSTGSSVRAPRTPHRARTADHARVWLALALLSLPVLLWTTRGAPLGTPVADDYEFLFRLKFHRPIGLFDAMGGGSYWRPVSRQLYYALFGPLLFRAPWLVATAHLALFATLVVALFRCASRRWPPPLAAAIASFPVLALPARTLLAWPSGGEPLLALVFVTLALQATLARRRWLAIAMVLGAALSYEQGLLIVPLLVAVVIARTRHEPGEARAWLVPGLLGAGLFTLGHLLAARAHAGVFGGAWPATAHAPDWPALGLAAAGQLGLEDLAPPVMTTLACAYGAVFAAGVFFVTRRAARERLARDASVMAAGAMWFAGGTLLAGFGSAGWYPWRTMLPGLGLAFTLVGALGLAAPWLAGALVAVRLAALLLAPGVPAGVEGSLPAASSRHAFVRVARLQRLVGSARSQLLASYPSLPRGAAVRYWALPEMTAWGFDGAHAVQVWYGDSTLTWDWLADPAAPHDAVLAFNPDSVSPAVVIEPASLVAFAAARRAAATGAARAADSLFDVAVRAQRRPADAYRFSLANEQARVAHALGADVRADSLNQLSWRLAGETAAFLDMTALLAMAHGRDDVAAAAARRCLELSPADSEAAGILRRLASAAGLAAGRSGQRRDAGAGRHPAPARPPARGPAGEPVR